MSETLQREPRKVVGDEVFLELSPFVKFEIAPYIPSDAIEWMQSSLGVPRGLMPGPLQTPKSGGSSPLCKGREEPPPLPQTLESFLRCL